MSALLQVLAFAGLALAAAAAPAPTLRYAGTLSDASGRPLYGAFLLQFRIFDDAAGGRQSWAESRYVKVEGGKFTAVLGQRQPLPAAVLRGAYRLKVEAPAGTGWLTASAAAPELGSSAGPAEPAVPAAVAPSVQASETPGVPPAAGLGRLERELARAKADAESARVESAESKRRLDALERGAKTAPEAAPAGPRVYTVTAGDTLRGVAAKLLGDERHWLIIYEANSDRLHRAGELVAGEKLVIPAVPR